MQSCPLRIRAGNLVLHMFTSIPASMLAEIITKTLYATILVNPVSFDIRECWHHVICHKVLVPLDRWESMCEEIGQELSDWNKIEGDGKDYVGSLALCKKEDLNDRYYITIKISLKKDESAQCLWSQVRHVMSALRSIP
jgi:hypothetical protein